MLRRVFGPKRDEVTGEWRKLHNEELSDLYSLPNIVRVSCLLHATSCKHRKLFCVKVICCIKFSARFSKGELRVNDLIFQCFVNCRNLRRFLLQIVAMYMHGCVIKMEIAKAL